MDDLNRTGGAGTSGATAAPAPKRRGSRKMSRNLVAVSAAAILAVYAAGYARTAPAAAQVVAQTSQVEAATRAATTLGAGATSTTSAATAAYRDGTYVGSGMSRHGGVTAQVVVQGGKIVSAAIVGSTTRYSPARIASLPPSVVNQQSTSVDTVSGATDSSIAFLQAVDNALAKAA